MGLSTPILLAETQKAKSSEYNNALGQANIINILMPMQGRLKYPICSGQYKDICTKCKAEARSKPKNAWLRDGKDNYIACFKRELEKIDIVGSSDNVATTSQVQDKDQSTTPPQTGQSSQTTLQGMSQQTKMYLAIGGGIAVLGLAALIILKK